MWRAFVFGLGLAAAPIAPLAAQAGDAGRLNVGDAVKKEREVYGAPDTRAKPADDGCGTAEGGSGGEIVVCARKPVDSARFRVKSTAELDPSSHQSLYDGLPRAPDVSGLPDCSKGCIKLGHVPPPALIIDLKAIPEPPPGSDADKIAKGEKAAP